MNRNHNHFSIKYPTSLLFNSDIEIQYVSHQYILVEVETRPIREIY